MTHRIVHGNDGFKTSHISFANAINHFTSLCMTSSFQQTMLVQISILFMLFMYLHIVILPLFHDVIYHLDEKEFL